jgi:hypothetical protein
MQPLAVDNEIPLGMEIKNQRICRAGEDKLGGKQAETMDK